MTAGRVPCIVVLAGTNGAGKSSIAGAAIAARGGEHFNPDAAARVLRDRDPRLEQRDANIAAWNEGKRLLERAISEGLDFFFETTLGGSTIAGLLERALSNGMEVRVWYAGLTSPELHIARVAARVARGGHDIPEADIRRRYDQSRQNIIRLCPRLTELQVYDNSIEADPASGAVPQPRLLLHIVRGRIDRMSDLMATPNWAKPLVLAALRLPT
jgi:predicted ABC-type ATPase